MLNNVALKLGVKNTEDIAPFLKSKLNELKTTNPTKYHEIMSRRNSGNFQKVIKS
jgi:hypothetical protein